MADPAKLSYSSSYDAFKQYDEATASISISGTVGAGVLASYSDTATLSRESSIVQLYYTTTVNSDLHATGRHYLYLPEVQIVHSNGSTPTFPGTAFYNILFESLFTLNTITLKATIFNPDIETLTVVSETLDFELFSFVAPFA